jgi:hypothetical protein
MEIKNFTYGHAYKFIRAACFLISLFCIVLGLVCLAGLVYVLTSRESKLLLSANDLFWSFIGFSVWSPLFYVFLSYLATDIEVEEDGIRVKFMFKSFFVNWKVVDEFKPGKTLGLLPLKRVRVLVTKNALTPFHRLYGLMYGSTTKPSLLIGTNISNHEELFKIIKNNRKKNTYKGQPTPSLARGGSFSNKE